MIRLRTLLGAVLLALAAGCASAGRAVAQSNAPVPDAQQDSVLRSLCEVQGYCENVTRQVRRFFHAPAESAGARGEVCFRIQRDGSVTDISTRHVENGGAVFRLAMLEAIEAARASRAFGNLPDAFDPARWRWCVELALS
jgi:hypothetical protein